MQSRLYTARGPRPVRRLETGPGPWAEAGLDLRYLCGSRVEGGDATNLMVWVN